MDPEGQSRDALHGLGVDDGVVPARYWHRLGPGEGADGRDERDDRIQCDLCPRHCRLHDGQRAFCFVRARRGDELVLTTYGRSTGFCVDPIEKKPLNHFLPGTPVLSFGTAGCNLGCRFCQNWDISKSREVARLSALATPVAIAEAAVRTGSRSVAFTYNDPVIWAEYAIDTAIACHEHDVRTVAVTAGYITELARGDFYRHIDAANVDLKAFSEGFYHKLCFAELAPVLETLCWLANETTVWLEVTTLLIPDHNDSDAELHALCGWFAEHLGPDVPLHFTAFHPDFKLTTAPRTPAATLTRARAIARGYGLRYVYTGNVHDTAGGTTTCPGCGHAVLVRDWYEILAFDLEVDAEVAGRAGSARCTRCATPIAGHFLARPGTWGSRRLPVRL